jgi:hypothetical protein
VNTALSYQHSRERHNHPPCYRSLALPACLRTARVLIAVARARAAPAAAAAPAEPGPAPTAASRRPLCGTNVSVCTPESVRRLPAHACTPDPGPRLVDCAGRRTELRVRLRRRPAAVDVRGAGGARLSRTRAGCIRTRTTRRPSGSFTTFNNHGSDEPGAPIEDLGAAHRDDASLLPTRTT